MTFVEKFVYWVAFSAIILALIRFALFGCELIGKHCTGNVA
jgi:hypothetical protein